MAWVLLRASSFFTALFVFAVKAAEAPCTAVLVTPASAKPSVSPSSAAVRGADGHMGLGRVGHSPSQALQEAVVSL